MDSRNSGLIYSDPGVDPQTIDATMMTTIPISMSVPSSSPVPVDLSDTTEATVPHLTFMSGGKQVEIRTPTQLVTMSDMGTPQFLKPSQVYQIQKLSANGEEAERVVVVENLVEEVVSGPANYTYDTPTGDGGQLNTAECLICGDRGSGYHYSVLSCEGCKGFFKRTVQKNLLYQCKDPAKRGICLVNKLTRNNCQYCRYQKCLQIGMKREAVREDRSPGGRHLVKRVRLDGEAAMLGDLAGEQLEDHHRLLLGKLVDANPDKIQTTDNTTPAEDLTVEDLMQFAYMELKYIIEWAKLVPGFRDLCMEDQMALLKSSFIELCTLRYAYRSIDLDNMIKVVDGIAIPGSIVDTMVWGHEVINNTLEFTDRLRELSVDKIEFCILNAIILTYPDATGIIQKNDITMLQTEFLDILRRYIFSKQPVDVSRFGKILLRLPTLRHLSAKALEKYLSLTLEGILPVNDLVNEMMS